MNPGDEIIHMTLADGAARALLLTGTQAVGRAEAIHQSSPVVTAAMGRALMGTALMAAMLKGPDDSVTVTIDGGGPVGKLLCACDGQGRARCAVDEPAVQLPLRADGKLDVGGAVGRAGRMSVVKEMGMKRPYVGQVALVSGEIAEDFAAYYAQSEQTPTLQALGVRLDKTGVLAAGGVLLQTLPGCPESVVSQLELRSPLFGDLSGEMMHEPMEALAAQWFRGLDPVIVGRSPFAYHCPCTRARMEKTLITLGREELQRMIEDEIDGAELQCHFCTRRERFTQDDLRALLAESQQKQEDA